MIGSNKNWENDAMGAELQYIELYTQHKEAIWHPCCPALNQCREKAIVTLRNGFPTNKDERYRYMQVDSLFKPNYGLNINRIETAINPYETFRCDVPNLSTTLYFVVNDSFHRQTLPTTTLPNGVIIDSLNQHPDIVSQHYNHITEKSTDAITALNTMLIQDGLLIYVPRHVQLERPIQVVNILHAKANLMANRRILVVLEEGAKAKLLLCDHTIDRTPYLSTQIIEVMAMAGSQFEYYDLEETHPNNTRFNQIYIRQETDSKVSVHCITLQNGTTRNTVNVSLNGSNADISLYGLAIADGLGKIDNYTSIQHNVPYCKSNELYKYILDDEATGAFSGKILVQPNAQKTIAQQSNKNICLTRQAHIYTQPQLEIYADDVKCSHGAAIGQLDPQAIFYLQQRGIPLRQAQQLLMYSFANEVIDTISLQVLRDRLRLMLEQRLRGELGKCQNCASHRKQA